MHIFQVVQLLVLVSELKSEKQLDPCLRQPFRKVCNHGDGTVVRSSIMLRYYYRSEFERCDSYAFGDCGDPVEKQSLFRSQKKCVEHCRPALKDSILPGPRVLATTTTSTPEPTTTSYMTMCQKHREAIMETVTGDITESFVPECDDNGEYLVQQCHFGTGYCWCVFPDGFEIPQSRTEPHSLPPDCSKFSKSLQYYKENFPTGSKIRNPAGPRKPTPSKPGECRGILPGEGVCLIECHSDEDCSGNRKCCSSGCGRLCFEPKGSPITDVEVTTTSNDTYPTPQTSTWPTWSYPSPSSRATSTVDVSSGTVMVSTKSVKTTVWQQMSIIVSTPTSASTLEKYISTSTVDSTTPVEWSLPQSQTIQKVIDNTPDVSKVFGVTTPVTTENIDDSTKVDVPTFSTPSTLTTMASDRNETETDQDLGINDTKVGGLPDPHPITDDLNTTLTYASTASTIDTGPDLDQSNQTTTGFTDGSSTIDLTTIPGFNKVSGNNTEANDTIANITTTFPHIEDQLKANATAAPLPHIWSGRPATVPRETVEPIAVTTTVEITDLATQISISNDTENPTGHEMTRLFGSFAGITVSRPHDQSENDTEIDEFTNNTTNSPGIEVQLEANATAIPLPDPTTGRPLNVPQVTVESKTKTKSIGASELISLLSISNDTDNTTEHEVGPLPATFVGMMPEIRAKLSPIHLTIWAVNVTEELVAEENVTAPRLDKVSKPAFFGGFHLKARKKAGLSGGPGFSPILGMNNFAKFISKSQMKSKNCKKCDAIKWNATTNLISAGRSQEKVETINVH